MNSKSLRPTGPTPLLTQEPTADQIATDKQIADMYSQMQPSVDLFLGSDVSPQAKQFALAGATSKSVIDWKTLRRFASVPRLEGKAIQSDVGFFVTGYSMGIDRKERPVVRFGATLATANAELGRQDLLELYYITRSGADALWGDYLMDDAASSHGGHEGTPHLSPEHPHMEAFARRVADALRGSNPGFDEMLGQYYSARSTSEDRKRRYDVEMECNTHVEGPPWLDPRAAIMKKEAQDLAQVLIAGGPAR